jgi:hypothetical protein
MQYVWFMLITSISYSVIGVEIPSTKKALPALRQQSPQSNHTQNAFEIITNRINNTKIAPIE